MLGQTVSDPNGIEGPPAAVKGLDFLPVDTVLEGDKRLVEVNGETLHGAARGIPFKGYEMHVGRTTGDIEPLLKFSDGRTDGAINDNGNVAGCYIHGLFTDDHQRRAWLTGIGITCSGFDYEADVDATLDLLADHIEKHVDCDRLLAVARGKR
jgi:adenosylcobyric acid synthase